jgi:hypothetical protein
MRAKMMEKEVEKCREVCPEAVVTNRDTFFVEDTFANLFRRVWANEMV